MWQIGLASKRYNKYIHKFCRFLVFVVVFFFSNFTLFCLATYRKTAVTGQYLGRNVSESNSVGSRPNCRCVSDFSGEFCNSPLVKLNDTVSWIQVPYKYNNGEWFQVANFILEVIIIVYLVLSFRRQKTVNERKKTVKFRSENIRVLEMFSQFRNTQRHWSMIELKKIEINELNITLINVRIFRSKYSHRRTRFLTGMQQRPKQQPYSIRFVSNNIFTTRIKFFDLGCSDLLDDESNVAREWFVANMVDGKE